MPLAKALKAKLLSEIGRRPAFPVVRAWPMLGSRSVTLIRSAQLRKAARPSRRRSATPGDRSALFAAPFALPHPCWLVTYGVAGALGAAAGMPATLLALAGLALTGPIAAVLVWPKSDPDRLAHDHPYLPARAAASLRHDHELVIDDLHPSWPKPQPWRARGRLADRCLAGYRANVGSPPLVIDRLHSRTRTILAMCCMALMAVLAAQGAITNVDRTQHALGVEHAPIPMAGAVHYDHDDHHDVGASDAPAPADQSPDDDDGRPAHHHYAEGPQLAALSADRLPELVRARLVVRAVPRLDSPALLVTARLERPPKTAANTLA